MLGQFADHTGPWARRALPLTTAWLLRPLQRRRMLGDALSRMKTTPAKRQVLKTIAGTFPGNVLKFRWHLVSYPACSLCTGNYANESQVPTHDLNASDQSGLWEPSSLEDYCDPDYIPSVDAQAPAAADTSDSIPPLSTADPSDLLAKAAAMATEINLGAREKSGRGGGRGGRSGRGRPGRAPARERLAGRTNCAQSCPDTR